MHHLIHRLRQFFRKEPTCEDVNRFLVEYLDGTLDPETRARFEAHLGACPKCKPYLEQYLATLRLVKEAGDVEPPPALVEHTLSFLRLHLDRGDPSRHESG
ncbi:MAG: hypothetical protein KatS3mg044_1407 [Rhodothermaceae bacterium]|nr:MAG: hypothetical protein D6746_11895 [Bacteroidota bacterium]GIV62541.1 MAG: hypothetical protein KatS3mg044_1407 [Rhodothermaceae bacterium]